MSTSSSSSDSESISSTSPVSCFFDPSTCQYQSFSIPEKIVYYMAKNCTNAETFQKLIETCKYFFKVNPVIVVPIILCTKSKWCVDVKHRVGFKYGQAINFKIWVTHQFDWFTGDAPQVIPSIYKNDATDAGLLSNPLKFEEFLFLAGNAEKLTMTNHLIKYENGKTVELEEIVENVPMLKSLTFYANDEGDVNCNTARKLMECDHFKNISQLNLYNVPEVLDVEVMFNYILENKHIEFELCYRHEVSDAYKELIREYSRQLEKESGCKSRIKLQGIYLDTTDDLPTSSSEDDSSDISFDNFDSYFDDDNVGTDVDENEDSLFPWIYEDEEESELPWDKE